MAKAAGGGAASRLADAAEAMALLLEKADEQVSGVAFRQTLAPFRLTEREMETALAVARSLAMSGISPSLAELSELRGVSKVTIYEQIKQLQKKGVLVKDRYKARGIGFAPGVLSGTARLPKSRPPVTV